MLYGTKLTTINFIFKKMTLQTRYQHLNVTIHNGLNIVTFNRPSKKNAINSKMYHEIKEALEVAAKDDRVVITALTGAGDYYSSGNDITDYQKFASGDLEAVIRETSLNLQKFINTFIDFPKILVAVVNGPAIGIAATTLALCDVVFASEKASFSTPFTSLGLSAEGCSTYTFPRVMGSSMAGEMLYFNRTISAAEAKACGYVSSVFPHDRFAEEVWPRLQKMAQLPPKSLHYNKQLIRRWDVAKLHEACAAECKQLEERWQSEECLNAIINFMQQRSKL